MSEDATDQQVKKRRALSKWWYFAAGLLLGALIILAIRYVTYHPEETHYHANFAVYIDGQREQFKGRQYYQEVKVCAVDEALTPAMRTHMHNEENSVVHVHDEAVTWGDFFANLGWAIGPDFIRTPTALYAGEGDNQLNVILNGENLTGISSIANEVIGNTDRLLVAYGDEDQAALDELYAEVPKDAGEYNQQSDPASCGGGKLTLQDRLRNLF